MKTEPRFLLIAILLLAVFFRFHALTEVPPGLTHDEADVGFFVRQIANNTGFVIEAPYGYANEPFTKYSASVVMWLVGQSDWALRAHQALWGVLLVVFTYKWGQAAFNRNVGVGGAALTAVSYWATATSRFALNSNPTAALFTGAVWLMWIALFHEQLRYRRAAWLGFAALLACSLMTYEASRGAWLSLPAFLIYLVLAGVINRLYRKLALRACLINALQPRPRGWKRPRGRGLRAIFKQAPGPRPSQSTPVGRGPLRATPPGAAGERNLPVLPWLKSPAPDRLVQFALAIALSIVLALPHLLNPVAWGRSSTLAGPLAEAAHGNPGPLWANTVEAFDALFRVGDNFTVYNLPGRPTIDPAISLLFIGGVSWCLWHWKKPQAAYALLWFAGGLVPATVSGARWIMLHAITLQGLVCVLSVVAVDRLAGALRQQARQVWVAFAGLVVIVAGWTYRDYYLVWGQAPEIRAAYLSNFSAVMDYVRRTPHTGSVTLSSPFPDLPHDPFSFDLRVHRQDIEVRWFDARQALVFPQADNSLLVFPSTTPLDPILAAHLPDAERHVLRPTDVDPYFDTLLWNPNATLRSWLNDPSLTLVQPPADFGGAAELAAFQVLTPRVRPGETVTTISFWKILDPAALGPRHPTNYAPEARLFMQLLDVSGNYVAGDDRLDAPAWNWRPGDTFVQIHHLALPPDLPPGAYELRTGIYVLPDVIRITGADFDSISLGPIDFIGN